MKFDKSIINIRLEALAMMLLICILSVSAQKTKTVEATITFHAPETMSMVEARRTALDRAKIEAIANEFGTIVSQSNSTAISNTNGTSNSRFISIGGSDVKGEWIETIGEPKYEEIFQDGMLAITCNVKGKAREITSEQIDFIAKPLRNGQDLKFEGYNFKSGDDLYLYFKSPVDGYLAAFLVDEASGTVYCALPYRNSDGNLKVIKADKEYILFSQKNADPEEKRIVDEYEMTANDDKEWNDFYILFSPDPFKKANLSSGSSQSMPKTTNWADFQKWLAKERNKNPRLNLQRIIISIEK